MPIAARGVVVTPTLQLYRDAYDRTTDPAAKAEVARWRDVHREAVGAMFSLGVPILAGSDAGWRATRFDTFSRELEELVECGLNPGQAIEAATSRASRAFGSDAYGAIERGRVADLLVVDGNVARDIRCLQRVVAVYLAGAKIRDFREG